MKKGVSDMYFNSEINTKEDLEKYSYLLDVDNKTLETLESFINKYKDIENDFYNIQHEYYEFSKKFKLLLEKNNIDIKDINTKKTIFYVRQLINKEVLKNDKYLNYIENMFKDNSIFLIDTFKENLEKGKIIRPEYIEKLKNKNNCMDIEYIIKSINVMEKSIFNKELKEKRILKAQTKIIDEINSILNKLCYILGIDYRDRDVKIKYFIIHDLLKNNNKAYNLIKENLKCKFELIEEIENLNLDMSINDVRKISEDGLNYLLEKLRLYDIYRKDNRFHIDFMVKR